MLAYLNVTEVVPIHPTAKAVGILGTDYKIEENITNT